MTEHHFFAASAAQWVITNEERDLQALLKIMDKAKLAYNLFLVPCSHDTDYEINWYQPQVAGTIHLGAFLFKQRKA